MDIKISINKKQRIAYIPKSLVDILGTSVRATPNRAAVLLVSSSTTINDALRSLNIIRLDLLHAKDIDDKKPTEV